ncbi:MAG: GNAT family N-acetyltransferase [Phycisphaerales bacterium]|nr:GNAT family N-acetyltransferase [Phycisphaerales bacterium]
MLRVSMARPESAIAAVVEGDRVLAAAGVVREQKVKRRHVAMIWGVYVTPSARSRGLGRAVMLAGIEAARGWGGVGTIELSVSESSPAAQRLYDSVGFVAWGREPEALRVDGRSFAEIHMQMGIGARGE